MSTCEKVALGEIQSEMPSWETDVEPNSQATELIRCGDFRVPSAVR